MDTRPNGAVARLNAVENPRTSRRSCLVLRSSTSKIRGPMSDKAVAHASGLEAAYRVPPNNIGECEEDDSKGGRHGQWIPSAIPESQCW
jgi:hypothetical protein